MKKPENDNIGLGLAASKSITVEMGGDIRLKYSRNNLTIFQFKVPVKIENEKNLANNHLSIYLQSMSQSYSDNQQLKNTANIQIFGERRQINANILDYLKHIFHTIDLNSNIKLNNQFQMKVESTFKDDN